MTLRGNYPPRPDSNRRMRSGSWLPCAIAVVEEIRQTPFRVRWAVALCLVLATCAWPAGALAGGSSHLDIRVLSNRADLISGGDALVVVKLPRGVRPSQVRMKVNDRNVTGDFAMRVNGRYEGRLDGVRLGRNVVTATAPGTDSDRIAIRNHAMGGPVFSGPQIQPWVCRNGSTRPQCQAPATYEYQYKSSLDGGLHPYDPDNPPSDVAKTTTQTGKTVPFIVRIETGYQDRDQYKIAVLDLPGKSWKPWNPQPQFNHKLLITHGASCGIDRQSGEAPSVTGDTVGGSSPTTALGMGFAVMSTALDNAGHNCNIATEAESLVMAKEHLIESYGTLRYTIGTGCSGGSLVQQQVANAYPGIYQGILPQCSFPDSWSTGQQLAAYHFDRGYFENPSKWAPGIAWTPTQIAAVEGHPNHVNAIVFDSVYWTSLADPADGCPGVPSSDNYDLQTNPDGVRCTLADYMINVRGPRPPSLWTSPETEAGTRVRRAADRRRRRPVRARGPEERRHQPSAIRGSERQDRRRGHRPEPDSPAQRRHPACAAKRLPQRRRQRGEQPDRCGDHRPAWAGPRRLPRRVPIVDHPRRARAPGGALPAKPRDLVRPDAADRRSAVHDPGIEGDGSVALGGGAGRSRPAACHQGGEGSARGRPRSVFVDSRRGEGVGARRRTRLQAQGGSDALRHSRDGRR